MWQGAIVGLLIGIALDSFAIALVLAIIIAALGEWYNRRVGSNAQQQTQTQIKELQQVLSQAISRIYQLEQHLGTSAQQDDDLASSTEQDATADDADLIAAAQQAALAPQPEIVPLEEPEPTIDAATTQYQEQPQAKTETPPVAAEPEPAAAPLLQQQPQPKRRNIVNLAISWLTTGNPIVKVGVLILFLGLSFLLHYVSEHSQLPISFRYLGVATAGVALLAFGWRLRKRDDSYGLILQGAGIGVLYLTTLAAMKLHPLLGAELGFVILVALVGLAVFLALRQNSQILMAIASLAGFAAPVLASTGSANHIFLFSYLSVINLGVLFIAWFRAWRALNLIGFISTFLLASAWGNQYYQSDLFALAEFFLILFFVAYVLAAFLFARRTLADASADDGLRQSLARVNYVDATLVFGVPFATYGLQYLMLKDFTYGAAIGALAYGITYAALAYLLFRNTGTRYRLLSETMIVLALVFSSLAIPLALDGNWTSASWAVEAAAIYWVGIRQNRLFNRLFALLLLLGSAYYFLLGLSSGSGWEALDGSWLGCIMLLLSLGFCWWQMRKADQQILHTAELILQPWLLFAACLFVGLLPYLLLPAVWAAAMMALIGTLVLVISGRLHEVKLFFAAGLFQFISAVVYLKNTTLHLYDVPTIWLGKATLAYQQHDFFVPMLISLAGLLCAKLIKVFWQDSKSGEEWPALLWSCFWWALAWGNLAFGLFEQRIDAVNILLLVTMLSMIGCWLLAKHLAWPNLMKAVWAYQPLLWLLWILLLPQNLALHPLQSWSALVWLPAFALHLWLLRAQQHTAPAQLQHWLHLAGIWLFLLIAGTEVVWWTQEWLGRNSVWAHISQIIVVAIWLALISTTKIQQRWPLAIAPAAYIRDCALPLVPYAIGWIIISSWHATTADSLPYILIFNPLELTQLLTLATLLYWWRSLNRNAFLPQLQQLFLLLFAVTGWLLASAMVLRACHHWGGVPWEIAAMHKSLLAQSSLSIVWSIIAISTMLLGNRRSQRWIWIGGATLIAIVVLKLFMVELSATGSLERIVSFIAVGILLLLVGYFAPLPPKQKATAA